MQGIKCLNVVIPAGRYSETMEFYRDGLGLAVLHEGPAHCFLRAGGVNLAIHRREGAATDGVNPALQATVGGIYLDFCVQSRQAAKDRLMARAIPLDREWDDANGKFLQVRDPEGNLLELIELP